MGKRDRPDRVWKTCRVFLLTGPAPGLEDVGQSFDLGQDAAQLDNAADLQGIGSKLNISTIIRGAFENGTFTIVKWNAG